MSNLGNQASQCSLDKVADALPPALKKSVLQSLNLSTFVWVIQNKDNANKIVKVLRENGFSNISLDSEGTTITAQSSSGQQSAGNDTSTCGTNYDCSDIDFSSLTQATNNSCSYETYPNCSNYYYTSKGEKQPCSPLECESGKPCENGTCQYNDS